MGNQRRRRDQRPDEPQPIRLTARDVDIIEAVHQYRVLKQDQLQALFFGSKSAAQRVLSRLFDHGFLERKFLPVLYGRSSTYYVLDRRGAELLRAERGYDDLNWYASSKDLKSDYIDHTTAINDFRVSITVAARRQGLALITWASESQLKADYDRVSIPGSRQPVSLIPDGYFILGTPRGNAHFFLEVDRGTETLDRFRQKVEAYIGYHQSGQYERRYGTKGLRVLTVVAGGEGRLANLREATLSVTSQMGQGRRFWFALAQALNPDNVLSQAVWDVAGDETQRVLIEPVAGD